MIEPKIHQFGVVESTNDLALAMARQGAPEGSVATAIGQTKGRGRRGGAWWDGGESALASILLKPSIPTKQMPRLTFVASLAVARLLLELQCGEVAVKWPNDVLAHGRKIAGILVETDTSLAGTAAVIGIGLNANQREFPSQIEKNATSLLLETGSTHSIDGLVVRVAESVLAVYESYMRLGFEEILDQWRKYMWGIGRQATVASREGNVSGVITGLSPKGALLLQDQKGILHEILTAESIRVR